MPSSLHKVQKHVNKKKPGAKSHALHENSRDAIRLRRASGRDDKVARAQALREKANDKFLLRVSFLQSELGSTTTTLNVPEIQALIEKLLARNDDALSEEKALRRPGRPASTRQGVLEQGIKEERNEYEGGFWVPDLRQTETVETLARWGGTWNGLANMKFVRVDSEGRVRESAFPPKGAA